MPRSTLRRPTLFAALLTVLALLTACTSETPGDAAASPADDRPPVAKLTATPADAATGVPVLDPVKISVTDGSIDSVELTNPAGEPVEGAVAEDKASWTTAEPLGYGKKYTYTASATGTDGKTVELAGSFTTVAPKSTPRATINPIDDAVVGVGMPISVKFPEGAVQDKAAVEKALKVETSVPVEGSWAWLHDRQVDWRPKEYWPENTEVKVTAGLYGVAYGGGAYGKADLTTEFSIGRNQVVKIHTPNHRMDVYRDGKLYKSYPASNGKDADPNLNTPNGTMIVMAKEKVGNFSNPRYGYTDVEKLWAVRFSNHGEFIHENEENRANIGKRNTSHGCVNLFEADAKDYFDSAIIGDPVEVTGAKADMPTTSDVNDWLFSWAQWQSMSALN